MGQSQRRTLLFILIPMLATFALQRLILHHSTPDTHVYIGGYVVHHLFSGALILIPTSFLLAFGIHTPWRRNLALATLGFSSAMVLDEIIYLISTDGSGVAYRGPVSFWGAVVLMTLGSVVLLFIHWRQKCALQSTSGREETTPGASTAEA